MNKKDESPNKDKATKIIIDLEKEEEEDKELLNLFTNSKDDNQSSTNNFDMISEIDNSKALENKNSNLEDIEKEKKILPKKIKIITTNNNTNNNKNTKKITLNTNNNKQTSNRNLKFNKLQLDLSAINKDESYNTNQNPKKIKIVQNKNNENNNCMYKGVMTSGNTNEHNNLRVRIKENFKKIILPKLNVGYSNSKKSNNEIENNNNHENNLFTHKYNINKIKITTISHKEEENYKNNTNEEEKEKDKDKLPMIQSASISKPTTASITPKYKGTLSAFANINNNILFSQKREKFHYNP